MLSRDPPSFCGCFKPYPPGESLYKPVWMLRRLLFDFYFRKRGVGIALSAAPTHSATRHDTTRTTSRNIENMRFRPDFVFFNKCFHSDTGTCEGWW